MILQGAIGNANHTEAINHCGQRRKAGINGAFKRNKVTKLGLRHTGIRWQRRLERLQYNL